MIAARREGPRDSHSGIGAKFAFFGRILGASGNIERKREAPLPARKQMRKNSTNPGPWLYFRPRAFYLTQHSPGIRPPIGPFIATFTKR
jgi:hypothetical protein